jgi:hypothetical protein
MQGHRSHLAQAKKCHKRWQADLNTMCIPIPPQNLLDSHSEDDNETAETGERLGTNRDSSVDWNVDTRFPEPLDNEALVLEESEDEDECRRDENNSESLPSSNARWREDFPHQAGQRLRRELTVFESLRKAQVARGESIWGMFTDKGDWEFAQWILNTGTTHASTNKLLDLEKVSQKSIVEYWTY